MSIRLFNNSGGYIDLNAGGDGTAANTFTLPAETGTVLTSGTAVSSIPGSGALFEADQWRITTVNTYTGTGWQFITTNWERADSRGFNKLGTGMSESSGIFTFPRTGLYLLTYQQASYHSTTNILYIGAGIWVTTDNSGYNVGSVNYNYVNIISNDTSVGITTNYIFNVTNTTNCKCKFGVDRGTSTTYNINGDTETTVTGVNFVRLGDSV